MHLQVYSKKELVAEMDVNVPARLVTNYKVYSSDILHVPFGKLSNPTYEMLLAYLESRCPPRTRANIKHLLNNWGLVEYDALAIVKRTHGMMFSDFIWIRFDWEDINYDEIKIRD